MNINLYYNSHDLNCKNPFGAVKSGDKVTFKIYDKSQSTYNYKNEDFKEDDDKIISVTLYYYLEEDCMSEVKEDDFTLIEMKKNQDFYETSLSFNDKGLYFYFFKCLYKDKDGHESVIYLSNSHDLKGGIALYSFDFKDVSLFQLTSYNERISPKWYKNSIFYQIFPDRFNNGNEDGKLSSIKQSSFLYSDWYDTPMYIKNVHGSIERWDFFGGNLKGIENKIPYLKELGIDSIYLNPIFKARSNHRYDTGDYHIIDEMLGTDEDFSSLIKKCEDEGISIILDGVFNHTGKDSKYFNIYGNYDAFGACQSKDSPYYPWYSFKEYPKIYECWWGIDDLPNINENVESFRSFILNEKDGVVPYWLRKGAKGWRLDVADELPDDFIKDIRQSMDKVSDDTLLMGEVWEDASNKIAYDTRRRYLLGDELNSVMNYPYRNIILELLKNNISTEQAYREFMSIKENYPKEAFYSNFNFLGTHDTRRIRTELEDDSSLKIAVNMLMTLPGVPSVYYGDEAGLMGNADPNNRKTYPWGREDSHIMNIYKEAIKLRKSSEVFIDGEFKPFFTEKLFGYIRDNDNDSYLCLINPTQEDQDFTLTECFGNLNEEDRRNLSKVLDSMERIRISKSSMKTLKIQ